MPEPVTVQFAAPPPDFCPMTFEQTVSVLNTLVSASIPGTFTPYIVQDAVPTVGQQSYIWFKTLGGKPVGIYKYFSGLWRKVYTGSIGDIKMFSGDPATIFDGTGKGVPGGEQDGWYLCNGLNGTPNLTDRFIVGAHMDNSGGVSGYAAGWKSDVEGTDAGTGGSAEATLTAATTYQPAVPAILVHEWMADGNTGNPGGPLFGEAAAAPTTQELVAADAGNTAPDPFFILPPWYALAFLQFKGY